MSRENECSKMNILLRAADVVAAFFDSFSFDGMERLEAASSFSAYGNF